MTTRKAKSSFDYGADYGALDITENRQLDGEKGERIIFGQSSPVHSHAEVIVDTRTA